MIPVGTWTMRTADSVLFTYWPPAPPDLNVSIAQIVGLDLDVASFAGLDFGNDVDRCKRGVTAMRRSNGESRTRRWTPRSLSSIPYALRPRTKNVTDFSPASSAGDSSTICVENPFDSAQRRYMRASIAAQSAASTPPAPAKMLTIALCESNSPLKLAAISSALDRRRGRPMLRSASCLGRRIVVEKTEHLAASRSNVCAIASSEPSARAARRAPSSRAGPYPGSLQNSFERDRSSSSAIRRRLAASSKTLLERLQAILEAGERRSLAFRSCRHSFLLRRCAGSLVASRSRRERSALLRRRFTMYVQPLEGSLAPNSLSLSPETAQEGTLIRGRRRCRPPAITFPAFVPPRGLTRRRDPRLTARSWRHGNSVQGFFGPLMGMLQQLMQMLQSLMGYGCNCTVRQLPAIWEFGAPPYGNGGCPPNGNESCPPFGNDRFFQNAAGSSDGDPHLSFNGAQWNNMASQPDLLNSDSFAGGFRISTQATPPNAKGVTWNQSATVSLNNGATTITMNNNGEASITSYGQALSIERGQTLQLGDGESVKCEQNGSLRVTAQNAQGGQIRRRSPRAVTASTWTSPRTTLISAARWSTVTRANPSSRSALAAFRRRLRRRARFAGSP